MYPVIFRFLWCGAGELCYNGSSEDQWALRLRRGGPSKEEPFLNQPICYVVGAMPLSWSLCPHPGAHDFVIAADKGYEALEAYGVPPDLVVGDFDSLGRRPSHPNVVQLPTVKDDTDMVYALREGLKRGFRRFVLLGGVGGRLEHTLANLQTLAWLTTQGARGVLAGEGTVATVLRSETMTFPAGLTGFWSAFCLSGTAEGVTLRNLKYELTDYTISADFPLGVSNEFQEQPAQVSVRKGALLTMWREQGDFYRLLPQLWNREPIEPKHEGE